MEAYSALDYGVWSKVGYIYIVDSAYCQELVEMISNF